MAFDRVKQFKEVTFDYESPDAAVPLSVLTDMPGGAMAVRSWPGSLTGLPVTTTRRTYTLPMDGIEGTLVQFKTTLPFAGKLKIYGAVCQVRPVGLYIDGVAKQIWETQPLDLGTPKVKDFKDVTLEYEATAANATLKVYVDLGAGLAVAAKTLTLVQTTQRTQTKLALDGVEGRLVKFRIDPPAAGVVRAFGGSVRFRTVGEYIDGNNGEIWETQELGIGI